MATICFYAQFTASKAGLDGLTVTWDVDRITRADGTRLALVSGDATNIIIGRRGLYGFLLPNVNLELYDYMATGITSDVTVDLKEVSALWTLWSLSWHDVASSIMILAGSIGKTLADNIDAKITSRLSTTDSRLNNLDGAISTRLPTSSYVAPANATISSISSTVNLIPTNPLLTNDSRLNNLDATISSRSTVTLSEIWNYVTRTLTSGGGGGGGATAKEIWEYEPRSLTSASGIASEIWNYEFRTLTAWRQIVVDVWKSIPTWFTDKIKQLDTDDYFIYRGVTNTISILTGMDNLKGSSNIIFTIKNKFTDPDSSAIMRIELINGLITLNGGAYPTPTDGSIDIMSENNGYININIKPNAALQFIPSQARVYDIKAVIGNDINLVTRGKIDILPDVTNAV